MVQARNLRVQADGSRRRNAVGATLCYRNLLGRQMVQMKIKIVIDSVTNNTTTVSAGSHPRAVAINAGGAQ